MNDIRATMSSIGDAEPAIIEHEDGVYFDMPFDEYLADPALGSSSVKKLRKNPSSYWYDSWMNPHRPPDRDTPWRLRGRALHKLVYEGEQTFDAMYARGPDQDPDATPAEKAAATKEFKKRALARGRAMLDAGDYDRIVIASAMITKNPELSTVFAGGMPEVSVFLTIEVDGEIVRIKARFDYLKIRGIGDLKSVANILDLEFQEACLKAVSTYRYDIQAKLYLNVRAALPEFVSDGAVHGDYDREWLRKVANAQAFGWQWIFYQTEGAPITWSTKLSPANPMCEVAQNDIDAALQRFVDYRRQYGTDQWLLIEPVREIEISEMPSWYARNRPQSR